METTTPRPPHYNLGLATPNLPGLTAMILSLSLIYYAKIDDIDSEQRNSD